MSDDARPPPSTLKGRLADVYVPALVDGQLESLSRRLGNRATVDDPLYGRASSLASLDPLIAKVSTFFAQAKAVYRHVYSTTGVDRDVCEGTLALTLGGEARELPIAVVAERRRLREIELRLYYAPPANLRKQRAPILSANMQIPLPQLVGSFVDALRDGARTQALSVFEESAVAIDQLGQRHGKADGGLGSFLSDLSGATLEVGGTADDGRTSCVETSFTHAGRPAMPALIVLERGESGLVREMRFYADQ